MDSLRCGLLIGKGMVGVEVFADGTTKVSVIEGTAYEDELLKQNDDGSYCYEQINQAIRDLRVKLGLRASEKKVLLVHDLTEKNGGCPMIWVAKDEDEREVTFRFRWGVWTVYRGPTTVFRTDKWEVVASGNTGDAYNGICSWAEFTAMAKQGGLTIAVVGE